MAQIVIAVPQALTAEETEELASMVRGWLQGLEWYKEWKQERAEARKSADA